MLNEEQIEIVKYNIAQIVKCLKICQSTKKFFKEIHIRPAHYKLWLSGNIKPTKKTIMKICNKLNIDYDVFVQRKITINMKIKLLFEIKEEQ